jgi:hypothetical protein
MQSTNEDGQKQNGLSWSTPAAGSAPATKAPVTPAPMSQPPRTSGGSKTAMYVAMLVLGVIAGIVIAWGWAASRSTTPTGTNTNSTAGTNTNGSSNTNTNTGVVGTTGQGSDPSLTIITPQAAGTSVAVQKAIVSQPTWIVVYEDKDGEPGNALGAGLFFPEKQNGTVELLRATVSGRSYLVTKQVDNGDRKFSLHGDAFLTEGGQPMWVSFKAQ